MGRKWLVIGAVVALSLSSCTSGGEVDPTAPPSTSTTSASPQETPTPNVTPESEEDKAVEDAIEIYRAFIQAMDASAGDPQNAALLASLLDLTTEDGQIRQDLLADTEFMKEHGYRIEGHTVVKRVSPVTVNLVEGRLMLAACLDLRELSPVGEGDPARPEFVTETPELHLVEDRWLVHDIQSQDAEC